jgi:PAS domain S-box-containing protein
MTDTTVRPIEHTEHSAHSDDTLRLLNEFEELVSILSAELVQIATDRIDGGIQGALAKVSQFVGADDAYIFLLDADEDATSKTYRWSNPEITREGYRPLAPGAVPWIMRRMIATEDIVATIGTLPVEATRDKAALEAAHLKSLVAVPLSARYTSMGFVCFGFVSQQISWNQETVRPIRSLVNLLGSLFMRKRTAEAVIGKEQAERALRESEERHRLLLESSPDPIVMYDMGGRAVYVNPAFTRIFGWARDEVIGKRIDFVPPENIRETGDGLPRMFQDGRIDALDTRRFTKDGKILDIQLSASLLRDTRGNPQNMIVSLRDVTERRRAQEALRIQSEELQHIIDTMPALIWYKDTNNKILRVNKPAAESRGMAAEAMVGKSFNDIYPENTEANFQDDQEVLRSGQPQLGQAEKNKGIDGKPIWVETDKIPYRDEQGVIAGLIVISRNVTERKEAERKLKDLLLRESEARREAQEANRLKDLFLATMSHELRTPLNAIIGFQHLMIFSEKLDEDNTHMAERSLANSKRLLNLINNILDISRIASGRMEIIPINMSPRKMAQAIYEDMHMQASEKGLTFEIEVDPALPEHVRHDEERITQIATNLVGNAIKFTGDGKVRMALRRQEDRLILEVADTGIGIPPSKQQIIFDDFVQLDGTSTRKFGGAGLGLSIVKRLAILMGGSIRVAGDAGKGSTFTVELPLEITATK